jgi:hypothetical protein
MDCEKKIVQSIKMQVGMMHGGKFLIDSSYLENLTKWNKLKRLCSHFLNRYCFQEDDKSKVNPSHLSTSLLHENQNGKTFSPQCPNLYCKSFE